MSAQLAAEQGERADYQDLEETEFVEAGKPQVEADLIVYADDTLIVAECKSTDQLSNERRKAQAEIRKKCQVAAWLRADQLVFATSAPVWTESTIKWIEGTVAAFDWPPLARPDLRLITNLGAQQHCQE